MLHTLQSLNEAERTGSVAETVAGFAALSIGLETAGLRRFADGYSRRARAAAAAGDNPPDIAFAALVALVLHAGRADWSVARTAGVEAADLYKDLGADGRWQQTMATLVHADLAREGPPRSSPFHAELDAAADIRTSAQIRVWSLWAHLLTAMRGAERPDTDQLNALIALLDHPKLNEADRLGALSIAALAQLRCSDREGARATVARALDLAERRPPAAWHVASALDALTVAAALTDPGTPVAIQRLQRARTIAARLARTLPVARPTLHFAKAMHDSAQGKAGRARLQFARSRAVSLQNAQTRSADLLHATLSALEISPELWPDEQKR
ncbi:hypothetical protein POI8812_03248 [Pontivivens insulae]|uniref:Uncharacterized protein n=1 Tax=Pontivivens insulae TaxID=1639689 RepID=A0A2R8AF78_9RHOB|nr:hypothetical protein DFR53_2861 [Pontivivens insulae]SPF30903.1 hypothetical protein POI8812_03248 [Pontivivens insulae]